MDEIRETGGAIIGFAHASFPFATLIVNKNSLQLRASIIGNLIFKPTDIISIEPYSFIFTSGIKINHCVGNYSAKVIFLVAGAAQLINDIEETGFLANKEIPADVESQIRVSQLSGGFPVKISAAIAFVVIWNILCLLSFRSFFNYSSQNSHMFIGGQLATAFAFLTGLLLFLSKSFRQLVLKPDKTINDVKSFLLFMMFICAMIFIGISFMPN